MSRNQPIQADENSKNIVERYESFISNNGASGYFDVDEMERVIDFYLQRGRTKESAQALDFALQLHPQSYDLQTKRAKIYLATGENHKAYKILEKRGTEGDYEVILLKIDALIRLERAEEANMLAEQLIQQESSDLDFVYLDLAYIYLAQYDLITAKEYLLKGYKHNPKNTEILFELAFCYEHTDDADKAIETYHQIIEMDAYSAEAWFNLGQTHYALRQLPEALEAFEYARVIRPESMLTCLQKAHVHFLLQQYEEALEEYLEYQKSKGKSWQSSYFIGESYEQMEQYDNALTHYFDAIKDNPENPDILNGIIVCMLELRLYEESIPFINRAIALDENLADSWAYMADAQLGLENYDLALEALLKSIEIDDNQPETLMNLGSIYMKRGEYEEALRYFEKTLEKDVLNELEDIQIFVSIMHHFLGNDAAADETLKLAMSKNLDVMKLFEKYNDDHMEKE